MEEQKLPMGILETRVLCPICRRIQMVSGIIEAKTAWEGKELRGQALDCSFCGVTFQVPVGLPSDTASALLEACEAALAQHNAGVCCNDRAHWTPLALQLDAAIKKARGEGATDG